MPLTERRINTGQFFSSDAKFNEIYPLEIKALAARHWTPIEVARKATDFLVNKNNVRILDIGSGVGKFCLNAAFYKPKALFYGVEQRRNLVNFAEKGKRILRLENVVFIHGNFTQLDFKNYSHFYFYNPFYENLVGTNKIDDSIDYSSELFNYYNRYLFTQLEQKPVGTRLVTFYSMGDEVPSGYHVVHSEMNNLLKFWIKK
jgi:hypothetical protein